MRLDVRPRDFVDVRLGADPGGIVALDPTSLRFGPADFDVPVAVTVRALHDEDLLGGAAEIRLVSDAVGTATVSVDITDDDAQRVDISPSLVSLREGDSSTVAIRLAYAPAAPVVLTLAADDPSVLSVSPASITIGPGDWRVAQIVRVGAEHDVDVVDGMVGLTASAIGVSPGRATVTIMDDDEVELLVVPSRFTMNEGTTASLEVQLAFQPASAVEIAVASSSGKLIATPPTITMSPATWDVPRQIRLQAVQDIDVADETVIVTVVGPTRVDVPVFVSDDDRQFIVSSAASLAVAEGGVITTALSLGFEPPGPVTVAITSDDPAVATVTPGVVVFDETNYAVSQIVTIAGTEDVDTFDEQVDFTISAAGADDVIIGVTVADDDVQSIVVDTSNASVLEGASVPVMVRLAFQPEADVQVAIVSSSPSVATVSESVLIFSPTNYDLPRAVDIGGVEDLDTVDESAFVTISAVGLPPVIIGVRVEDNDGQSLIVDTASVTVTEGARATVGVRLAFPPPSDVVVQATLSSTVTIELARSELTFGPANYDVVQDIEVVGLADDDLVGATGTLTLRSAGLADVTVAIAVLDDDEQGIIVSPRSLTTREASSAALSIRLAFRPGGPVVVAAASSDEAAASLSIDTLTFTPANYATPQVLTVAGVADADVEDETVEVLLTAAGVASRSVSVTVVDDDVVNLDLSPSSLSLSEGGTGAVVAVGLTTQPAGDVVVTMSPSEPGVVSVVPLQLTFTPANWDTAQSVLVSALDDGDTADAQVDVVAVAPGLSPRVITVAVIDDDEQAVVVTPSTLAIAEGDGTTVAVRLAFDPVQTATVAVVPSTGGLAVSPSQLVFGPTDFASPQIVRVDALHDADLLDAAFAIRFQSAVAGDVVVSVTVADDDVQRIVVDRSSISIDEGSSDVVAVNLAFAPANSVTVSIVAAGDLSATPSSLAFDSSDYAVPQLVTLTALSDADASDDVALLTLATAGASDETVGITIVDDDTQSMILSATQVAIDEGLAGAVTVRLATDPGGSVDVSVSSSDPGAVSPAASTLTFTSSNFDQPQALALSALEDLDTRGEVVIITLSSAIAPSRAVQVTVRDNDTQALILGAGSVTVDEGGQASVSVALAFDPVDTATVTVTVGNPGIVSVTPTTLFFTSANYAAGRSLSLSGLQDDDVVNGGTQLELTTPVAPSATLPINVVDDDTQQILVAPASVAVVEGQSATFEARLAFAPVGPIVIAIASAAPAVATVGPSQLSFTPANYQTPQVVTVTAPQDVDTDSQNVAITLSTGAVAPRVVTAVVTDDDAQALVISPAMVSVAEGAAGTFSVNLAFDPGSSSIVTLVSSHADVTVTPASLTFDSASFNTPQQVSISAASDDDTANRDASVTLMGAGVMGSVAVQVVDDDVQALIVAPQTLSVVEGGSADGTVRLAFNPTGQVTVSVASADEAAASVAPAMLTFDASSWNQPQTFTVSGVVDLDANDEQVQLTLSSTITPVVTISVEVDDDDVQMVVTNPASVELGEGQGTTVDVSLAADPGGTVQLTVASADASIATVSPGLLTFDSATFATPRSVTITAIADADTRDEATQVVFSGATNAALAVVVRDDDVQTVLPSVTTLGVGEQGPAATFGVRLMFEPDGPVTVTVTSQRPGVVSATPGDLTFTVADYDVPRTVSVEGLADLDVADESVAVVLSAPMANSATVSVDVVDDDTQAIVTSTGAVSVLEGAQTTFEVRLEYVPTGTMQVQLQSDDPAVATVSPAVVTFAAGDYDMPRVVTVSGTHDADLAPNQTTISVTAAGVAPATVSVAVTDDDTQQILASAAALAVVEGDTASLSLSLAFEPLDGSEVIAVVSADPSALVPSTASLTFTAANYATPQMVTLTAVDDVDMLSNVVMIDATSDAPATAAITVTATISDDDSQVILRSQGSISLVEGTAGAVGVRLMFRPSSDVTLALSTSSTAGLQLSPPVLQFDAMDFDVDKDVTITALSDADIDDLAATLLIQDLRDEADPEHAPDTTVDIVVTDDDEQQIIVTSIPSMLAPSVQEGGPPVSIAVRLGRRPAAVDGRLETITATLAGGVLVFSPQALQFDDSNWGVDQIIEVSAAEDTDAIGATFLAQLDAANQGVDQAVSIAVLDDDAPVEASRVYAGLGGGTQPAGRMNVAWGSTRLAFTAYQGVSTIVASDRRDLSDPVTGVTLGNTAPTISAEVRPAEVVGFDGTDFGVFAVLDSGLAFARVAEDMTLATQVTVGAGLFDPSASYDGAGYRLVVRDLVGANLEYRTVAPTGTVSTPVDVTSPSAGIDEQPNLHSIGAGSVVVYTANPDVRCAVLDATGVAAADVALGGFPVAPAPAVSSVYVPALARTAVVYEADEYGLRVFLVDGACAVDGDHRVIRRGSTYLNPPVIASNGLQLLVGYDALDGTTFNGGTVLLDHDLTPRGDHVLTLRSLPSLTWAGDRWALRAVSAANAGAIELTVGAFGDHCADGTQNVDETGVDCGGSCSACGAGRLLVAYQTGDVATNDQTTGAEVQRDYLDGGAQALQAVLSADGFFYYVADHMGDRVYRRTIDGLVVNEVAINEPHGMQVMSDGRLLVCAQRDDRVEVFDSELNSLGILIDATSGVDRPRDVLYRAAQDDLLVSDRGGHRILRFDTSGALLGPFAALPQEPHQLAVTGSGNVLVGLKKNPDKVCTRELSSTGATVRDWIPTGYDEDCRGPHMLPNGDLLVATKTGVWRLDQAANATRLTTTDAWYIEAVPVP